MYASHLLCIKCGKKFPLGSWPLTCHSHSKYYGYLTVVYSYENIKNFPLKKRGILRYLPLLPINKIKISLGEGSAPVIKLANMRLSNFDTESVIYVKNEGANPTGCFKDKESLITINKALELGIKEIFVISSGNAALSVAAYAKKAGITCTCFIPKKATASKKELIKLYGGKAKEIEGAYEGVYTKIIDSDISAWNCTPGINPYAEEGDKITAFEIWDEIGVPDKIIVPCGNGTNLAGIWKGFKELKLLGKINKLPQMIGVQIKGAAPIKIALKLNKDFVKIKNIPDSVAEGIVASESYSAPKAKKAIEESKGALVEVDDKETIEALKQIIDKESLIPEPTSATVFAALKKLSVRGEKIVCILTGTGIKNLKECINLVNKND